MKYRLPNSAIVENVEKIEGSAEEDVKDISEE
jgi:hypothetical protein